MDLLFALLGVLAVLHVVYATWTANRLDRLHQRVDAAVAALDAQLRQRSDVAAEFAARHRLPALAEAAEATFAVTGLGHDREAVENDLSRALRPVAARAAESSGGTTAPDDVRNLEAVMTRTSFARRFHNDTVRDVLEVRTRRVVRWFRLAGSARLPAYFEIDDTLLDRRTIEV